VVQDLGIPSPAQWRYAWVTMRPKLVRHWQCPWLRVSLLLWAILTARWSTEAPNVLVGDHKARG